MVGSDHDIEYRILGPMELVVRGEPVATGSPQQRGLLAILLLNANKIVRAEQIIGALWDDPPATALGQVQTRVWRLRQLLRSDGGAGEAESALVTMPGGYLLTVDPAALDLELFRRAVERARGLHAARRFEQSADAMREALALWRGPVLGDVDVPWVRAEAANLEELRLAAWEERIETDLALGRHRELISELRNMVETYPMRERPRAHLMLALYRSGRQAEALEAFGTGYRLLADNLGLEPTADLRLLHHAILTGDPGLDLKTEIQVSERSSRLSPRELPAGVAWFTGRECVLAELRAFLTSTTPPHSGVVATVSGPPGTGKTALAVELGHSVAEHFPDGQIFVDLRGQDRRPAAPSDVLGRLLTKFGLSTSAIPETTAERAAAFRTLMADLRALVVLDNAAHAAQVRPLLPAGSGCAVVITSRQRFASLESTYHVDLDAFSVADGVALLDRIIGPERLAAEPEVARRIVELCGRLPLAIWAAGARVRARPHWKLGRFAAMLEREDQRLDMLAFGDLDVRSAFLSSYTQLERRQRLLFRRLGSLGVPDIPHWVPGQLVDATPEDGEELIESLVEARLVDVAEVDDTGAARYRMGDLMRLFAKERAEAEDATDDVCAALGGTIEAGLRST
ncbi:MAG TPA: BTAD domain-containing putative transcriptional regulator [Pseudonocardiaceae bacterium]